MRLPKTFYTIHETRGEILGYDDFGRPYYQTEITYKPFKGESEPYSSKKAETNYGLFVDVSQRVFCRPNPDILIGAEIRYDDEVYTVNECLKYDKHFEVLIKKGGA
ncbi:hypothetical protein ACQCT5_04685 [Sutcliffiella halmapala]